jgi:hypothetical protein
VSAQPNAELAWRVLDHIDANPEQWDQGKWIGEAECGTVACFAGWTVLLSGGEINTSSESVTIPGRPDLKDLHIEQAAQRLLGVRGDVMVLYGDPFDGLLTRDELGERVTAIFGPRPAEEFFCGDPNCSCGDDTPPNAGSAS